MSYKAFAVVTDGNLDCQNLKDDIIKCDNNSNEKCNILTQLKVCESSDAVCFSSLLMELQVCEQDDVGCMEKYNVKDLELPTFKCIYADSTTTATTNTSSGYEEGSIDKVIDFVEGCPEKP